MKYIDGKPIWKPTGEADGYFRAYCMATEVSWTGIPSQWMQAMEGHIW